MTNQHDPRYDVLKGLGIIMMVAFHGFAPICIRQVGNCFHMAVFFILAGWLFDFKHTTDIQNVVSYIRAKAIRLWWPSVFWGSVFIASHNLLGDIHLIHDLPYFYGEVPPCYVARHWTAGHVICEIAKEIFLLGDCTKLAGAFWFLKSLLFALAGYCLVSWLMRKRPRMQLPAQSAIAAGALILGNSWHMPLLGVIGGSSTLTAYALIHIGTVLRHFDLRIERLSAKQTAVVGGICLIVVIALSRFGTVSLALNRFPDIPFLLACSLCGWYFLMAVSTLIRGKTQTALAYVGVHTMPIVLLHFLAFKTVSAAGVLWLRMPVTRIADFSVTFTGGGDGGSPTRLSASAFRLPFQRWLCASHS